jgi:hypothetical protein
MRYQANGARCRGQDVAAVNRWLALSLTDWTYRSWAGWKMDLLVSGAIIFAVGAVLFWYCLPRGGKTHRFVGTELEPYIAVAFCAGVALSFTLMLSGLIALMEEP